MGVGQIFLKNLCDTSFNKDLSNNPTFGRIHLAGQYLYRSPLNCYIRKKSSRLRVHLCIFIPSGANNMQNEWPHSSYLRMDISIKDICCPTSPLPRDIIAPLMTVDNCCRQMVLAAPSFLTSSKDNVYTLDHIPCRAWLSAEFLMEVNAVCSTVYNK